jgi:hypothetical protein
MLILDVPGYSNLIPLRNIETYNKEQLHKYFASSFKETSLAYQHTIAILFWILWKNY